MLATADCPAHGAKDPQDRANHQQNDANGLQYGYLRNKSHDQKHDSENDHPSFLPVAWAALSGWRKREIPSGRRRQSRRSWRVIKRYSATHEQGSSVDVTSRGSVILLLRTSGDTSAFAGIWQRSPT
jgi:hypothetical protein